MIIQMKKSDYDAVVQYCLSGLPNESCGLIAGFVDGDVKSIEKVYFLTNLDHNNVHFTMSPKEQFSAVKDARSLGLTMLGNFHSHPETPSRPSEEDKRLAYDSTAVYMICLLYTSDAADEEDSVDLCGRRIIKKKKRRDNRGGQLQEQTTYKHK